MCSKEDFDRTILKFLHVPKNIRSLIIKEMEEYGMITFNQQHQTQKSTIEIKPYKLDTVITEYFDDKANKKEVIDKGELE